VSDVGGRYFRAAGGIAFTSCVRERASTPIRQSRGCKNEDQFPRVAGTRHAAISVLNDDICFQWIRPW